MNAMTFLARFDEHGSLGLPVFLLMLVLTACVVLAVTESKKDGAKK